MTDTEMCRIAIDWIRFTVAETNSQEQFDTVWASTKESDMFLEEQFEDLWRLILMIYSLDRSVTVLGRLSSGPIETLLGSRGESFIDRIEEKAKSDPVFAIALAGIWRNEMSEKVWARLQLVCDREGLKEMYDKASHAIFPGTFAARNSDAFA